MRHHRRNGPRRRSRRQLRRLHCGNRATNGAACDADTTIVTNDIAVDIRATGVVATICANDFAAIVDNDFAAIIDTGVGVVANDFAVAGFSVIQRFRRPVLRAFVAAVGADRRDELPASQLRAEH